MGQKHTLFFAAGEGRKDDLRWVLYDKKVSPNLRDHTTQEVALHLAASKGHVECVKLLLKAGRFILMLCLFINVFLSMTMV
jgi:ankyrin repeat protein